MVFIDEFFVGSHPDLNCSLVVVDLGVIAAAREGVRLRAGDVAHLGAGQVDQASTTHPHLKQASYHPR